VITGGQNTAAENDLVNWIANGRVFGFPVVTVFAVLIIAIVAVLVRRTALGMMIESLGINPKASRLIGIRPKPLLITVYAASALLAGIGGIFSTASVMTVEVSSTGLNMEMDAILAVVVGGTSLAGGKFSIAGSVIGGLLITTLNKTIVFLSIPSTATPAFKAIVIVVVCLLQSQRVRAWLKRKKRPAPTPPTLPAADGEVVTDDSAHHVLAGASVESPAAAGKHSADIAADNSQTKGEGA
jgi:simple sugar transport system permease protein